MEMERRKRYSPAGWKYVNEDGSLWPQDEWIRYSAKHPRPLTVKAQIACDPSVATDKATPPWHKRPDPGAPRTKIHRDQWGGEETGGFFAYIIPVPIPKEQGAVDKTQTVLSEYFQKRDGVERHRE